MRRRSLSKAFMHYFQAAQAGHVQAMYNTAVMHMAGKGTPTACKPALSNLKALVEKGPLAAALQAGHEAFFRGQHGQVGAAAVLCCFVAACGCLMLRWIAIIWPL
jgi:TPR repeat protein